MVIGNSISCAGNSDEYGWVEPERRCLVKYLDMRVSTDYLCTDWKSNSAWQGAPRVTGGLREGLERN